MSIVEGTLVASFVNGSWDGASRFLRNLSVTVADGQTLLSLRIVGGASVVGQIKTNKVYFNSVEMTLRVDQDDGNTNRVLIYDLVNPSVGTYDVTTKSGIGGYVLLIGTPVSGVDTTSPVRNTNSNTAYNTTPTIGVTTVAGDLVIDVVTATNTLTVGAGQTEKYNTPATPANSGASSEVASGTTTTMSWTQSASHYWAIGAVAYVPASSPTAFTAQLISGSPLHSLVNGGLAQ